MNEINVHPYHITLRLIKPMPAVGPDGTFAQTARFHAEALDVGSFFDYEENATGDEFKRRCDYLISKGFIVVDVPQSICKYALNQIAPHEIESNYLDSLRQV